MGIEILSLLGGGVLGFVTRLLASQGEAQSRAFEQLIQAQVASDDSADRAVRRAPGAWVRRGLAMAAVFATVLAPFILALLEVPITVEDPKEWWDLLGVFSGGWESISGFVILPEVRQTMLAVTGFYLGSAQVRR